MIVGDRTTVARRPSLAVKRWRVTVSSRRRPPIGRADAASSTNRVDAALPVALEA